MRPGHGSSDDVAGLTAWAREQSAEALVCTCKDLVKLRVPRLGATPLWALSVGMEFLTGQADIERKLESLLPHARDDARTAG